MPFFNVLVATFLMQVIGCYIMKTNIKKVTEPDLRKSFKQVSMIFVFVGSVQFFVIISMALAVKLFKIH
jgi:hypothetical protein